MSHGRLGLAAGEEGKVQSKVYTRTPTLYLDFKLDEGVKHTQAIPKGWTAFIYTLSGNVYIGPSNDQQKVEAHYTAVLDDGDCVQLENKVFASDPYVWYSLTLLEP
uniref:Uncharacterized protein n=1 Tax=Sphaerodactylus townsendi TaxID=933632 RepID=A0ACB8FJ54_9SAUR